MKTRRLLAKRAFLNPVNHMDDGWIKYVVYARDYRQHGHHAGIDVDAKLIIADCSRTITLDLDVDCNYPKEYKQRMDKLNKLRQAIDDIQAAIQQEYEKVHGDTENE